MTASALPDFAADPDGFLRALFAHAVAAADPARCVPPHLPRPPAGRTLVIAAGKAAASMAKAVEDHWAADAPLSGIALCRYGHAVPCARIEVIEAAHPVPDDRGHEAARRMMEKVRALGDDDLLLCLISGGGSSLLALPAEGIPLSDKKALNRTLLASGAPIGAMNTVRKHVSAVKGGRLAQAAAPARIVTLAISDVPHDDPSTIASGPTVPDPTTLGEARAIVERYAMDLPAGIRLHLDDETAETPKPGDPAFDNAAFHMVTRPADMIASAHAMLVGAGLDVIDLGADIEGEARTVGAAQAARALDMARTVSRPTVLLSGGETTVTIASGESHGRGGRNVEYLLALAIGLDGALGIHAIAADTDGIDGTEASAGAVCAPDTLARARAHGMDAQAMLAGHDAFTLFDRLGDTVTTGPTLTNVNDLRAVLILPAEERQP